MLAQQVFNALVLGSVYALFSMGFTLTFGVLRVINLLYAFYVAAGAFLSLVAVRDFGIPLWAAAVFGAFGTGVIAVVCDTALLTPLRRAKAPELANLVVTLGGALLLNNLTFLAFGAEIRRFPATLLSQEPISLGPLQIGEIQLVIIAVVAVLAAALFLFMDRTRLGIAIRALAENPDAAMLMGVNVDAMVMAVSFVAATLIGVAGILIGLNFNAVHPFMGEPLMLRGFAVVVIGGLGDIRGALIAGLALGFVEVMTAGYISSNFKDAAGFAALVITLWLRPSGLFGRAVVTRA
ncbi:MAG: branched-chain amino acid ABC transporter permease [Hyphomicrobiales bacterium]